MAETLIDTLKNKEFAELKSNLEKVIQRKVDNLVDVRKQEILDKINGTETPITDTSTEGNTDTGDAAAAE